MVEWKSDKERKQQNVKRTVWPKIAANRKWEKKRE